MIDFPFEILRPGSPTEAAFAINEVPFRAKLDQNESPLELPKEVKARLLENMAQGQWRRYPQPARYGEVKEAFAEAVGQPADRVILTVGADQMIMLAFWAAAGAGRRARIFEPTYPMFAAFARNTGTEVDRVVLGPDFHVDEEALGDDVDLLMLVSPNNPTGQGPSREVILLAAQRNCMVFVDEAYSDYSGQTVIDLVDDHPNLLVARSLSKSMLAGIRLGYGVGHPDLINVLERLIFAPYHLNEIQLAAAGSYNLVRPHVVDMVEEVITQRQGMFEAMEALGVRVYPSRANFLLFEVDDAARVNRGLLDRGIRIRDVSSLPGMGQHLRVTVGTSEENGMFLAALEEALVPSI